MDYFEDGFAVREASWHGKERLLQEAPTTETWRQESGLTWEPVKVPLYFPAPMQSVGDDGHLTFGAAKPSGTYVLARNDRLDATQSDDPKVRDTAVLSRAVSEEYVPVEHERDMTPLAEAFIAAATAMGVKAEFTTAGSVRDGKEVYLCIQLDKPVQISHDPSLTLPYMTLLNPHGGGTVKGGITTIRIVCANTFRVADLEMDATKLYFRVRHNGQVEERLEEARKSIAGWLDAIDGYAERMNYLASLKADGALVDEWLGEFLPIDETRMTDRQIENRTREQGVLRRLHDEGVTSDGIRGTAYGLLMATTEFLDHVVPWRSEDTYLRRTMLEAPSAKALAAERITELCEAGVN